MANDETSRLASATCTAGDCGYADWRLGEMTHGSRVHLCGALSIELGDRRVDAELSGTRGRLCVAYLALNRDRPVRRDELVEALWPNRSPERPEAALATVLSRLRSALGPGVLEGKTELRLVLPAGTRVDVEEAAEAVARAEAALARGDAEAARAAAVSALEIVKRELLPGLDADWIEEHRRELEEVRIRALESRAEAGLRLGGRDCQAAERAARELIRLSPYRESAYRLLMEALAARGDLADALRTYEQLRMALRDDLGAVPGRELAALHQRLLEGNTNGADVQRAGAISPVGTLTILVAELAGVDALADRLGGESLAGVRATCLALLRDAARTSDGEQLQVFGDGLMLAFRSSLKALACATLMQRAIRHHGDLNPERDVALRVGVHVGEVAPDQDDYFGQAAAVARELCGRAQPGQVLVTELVRSLAGTRAGHDYLDLGALEFEGRAGPLHAHQLQWHAPAKPDGPSAGGPDGAGGSEVTPLAAEDIEELERVLALSGLGDVSLAGRYSVVFVYPGMGVGDLHLELAGCTTQLCAIIEETANFERHGIQVVGLSTEPTVPPAGCQEVTFPAGILPQQAVGGFVPAIDKGARKYGARTSYVLFPDGGGLRIAGVADVIAHVRKSFDVAIGRRLERYRQAAISHLERGLADLPSTVELRELLTAGADSVAIPRVQVKLDLVCKLADAAVVETEAGYIERINRLFDEHGFERLFPTVVAVATDEDPAWYLMEAVNPVPLDELLFEDRARTVLRSDRRHLVEDSLERISKLYELTFRPEVPEVARYHYLGRFLAIPEREDTRAAFESLVGEGTLDEMLGRRLHLDGGFVCRAFREQMGFLEQNLGRMLEPAGAYIHGDFHLPNMLLDHDGKRIVLIDPRVVWDGHDVGDPGFCDPVYDPATLLQSLHLAAPMLRAIADGESGELLRIGEFGGADEPLAVAPGILRLHGNPTVQWFVDWVERAMPAHLLGATWGARLHVGTANACFGWLKYARSLQTREAWLATFASALYHLELGRRALEGEVVAG